MQIHLLPKLAPGGMHENLFRTVDVVLRYGSSYILSKRTAVYTVKVIIQNMTRQGYPSTMLTSGKDAIFISNVIHELAKV